MNYFKRRIPVLPTGSHINGKIDNNVLQVKFGNLKDNNRNYRLKILLSGITELTLNPVIRWNYDLKLNFAKIHFFAKSSKITHDYFRMYRWVCTSNGLLQGAFFSSPRIIKSIGYVRRRRKTYYYNIGTTLY